MALFVLGLAVRYCNRTLDTCFDVFRKINFLGGARELKEERLTSSDELGERDSFDCPLLIYYRTTSNIFEVICSNAVSIL